MSRLLSALVAMAVTIPIAPTVAAAPEKRAARNLVVQPAGEVKDDPRRLALVIGNGDYADTPLSNPENDAIAISLSLEKAGFSVILRTDADHRDMLAALREFGNRLKGGGVGVFYFAGHGMQIKGRNYLIPVGADIGREDEVIYQSLDAQAVLDKMESAGNGTNIVILDACRNNPFARSFRSAQQGLAQMDAPVGTLVAFSTAPGSIASDGEGGNGLYTAHLLAALDQPGLKVEEIFKQVRTAVRRQSEGRQVPWESTSLEGDFYFHAPTARTPVASAEDSLTALDDALWETVKDSDQRAELQAYLRRFPAGRHAAAVRERLAELMLAASLTVSADAAVAPSAAPGHQAPVSAIPQAVSLVVAATPGSRVGGNDQSEPVVSTGALAMPAHNDADERQRLASQMLGQIARWGDLHDKERPADPRRNVYGFTEGDRFRYRVIDRMRRDESSEYGWRIDRITDDGDLVINGGSIRLNGQGHVLFERDARTGNWAEWTPPLAAFGAGLAPGQSKDVTGALKMGDGHGLTSTLRLSGSMRVAANERITTPAGTFDTVRIDIDLMGDGGPGTGRPNWRFWRHRIWYASQLGVWVAWEEERRVDYFQRLDALLRRELIAYDMAQVSQGSRLAGGAR